MVAWWNRFRGHSLIYFLCPLLVHADMWLHLISTCIETVCVWQCTDVNPFPANWPNKEFEHEMFHRSTLQHFWILAFSVFVVFSKKCRSWQRPGECCECVHLCVSYSALCGLFDQVAAPSYLNQVLTYIRLNLSVHMALLMAWQHTLKCGWLCVY